jgi:hypothetical protein
MKFARSLTASATLLVVAPVVLLSPSTASMPTVVALANTTTITGPAGSSQFGATVVTLTNGDIAVADRLWDAGGLTDVGAVRVYDGGTLALRVTIRGKVAGDSVGDSLIDLPNGNLLVLSQQVKNGAIPNAGAITMVTRSATGTIVVGPTNSLVGTSPNEGLGSYAPLILPNGNIVLDDPNFDNGAKTDVGAVIWMNGAKGAVGPLTAARALIGNSTNDQVRTLARLANGNYVVGSSGWDNGAVSDAGAVLLANGATGTVGVVTAANSLHGSKANDRVGDRMEATTNGNFVVISPYWSNGAAAQAGAVTFGRGTTGVKGAVSAANSLVGTHTDDNVGLSGVTPLTQGNIVVSSPYWDNGAVANVGATTWMSGSAPTVGAVSTTNSLVGSTAEDRVGWSGISVVGNGNYVVKSSSWDNGGATDVGAITWVNGSTGRTTGAAGRGAVVSTTNSLHGTTTDDSLGTVTVLTNGNYVAYDPAWDNGAVVDVGAATWVNGTNGRPAGAAAAGAAVSMANSLVGTTAQDKIGYYNVWALRNGSYVVASPNWANGAAARAGAATLGSGTTGKVGVVSAANSLVGTQTDDQVGTAGLLVLTNGNYVVLSPNWANGAAANAGAATWGSGRTGIVGAVTQANSLVGDSPGDLISLYSNSTALADGNYLVGSLQYDDGATLNAGAVTYGNGTTGTSGMVSYLNSLVGEHANDFVGTDVKAFPDGRFSVGSPTAGGLGAVTIANGPIAGAPTNGNSILGIAQNWHILPDVFEPVHRRIVVRDYPHNRIIITATATKVVAPAAARLADTRPGSTTVDGKGIGKGKLLAGKTLVVKVGGRGSVATTAKAVVLTVSAVRSSKAGSLTVWACGTRPSSPTMSFSVGQTTSTTVVTGLSSAGTVCVYTTANTHVVVDTFEHRTSGTGLTPRRPLRVLDTRKDANRTYDHKYSMQGTRPAKSTTAVAIAGRAGDGVPSTAKSAFLNLTVISGASSGRLTVYPCGATRTNAISLSFGANRTTSGLTLSKIGAGGKVCAYTTAPVNLVGDLMGHNSSAAAEVVINPVRIGDSGTTLQPGGVITPLKVAPRTSVPGTAYGVTLSVSVLSPAAAGRVVVFPCGESVPAASNINHSTSSTTALATTRVGTNGLVCVYHSAKAHLVVDLVAVNP